MESTNCCCNGNQTEEDLLFPRHPFLFERFLILQSACPCMEHFGPRKYHNIREKHTGYTFASLYLSSKKPSGNWFCAASASWLFSAGFFTFSIGEFRWVLTCCPAIVAEESPLPDLTWLITCTFDGLSCSTAVSDTRFKETAGTSRDSFCEKMRRKRNWGEYLLVCLTEDMGIPSELWFQLDTTEDTGYASELVVSKSNEQGVQSYHSKLQITWRVGVRSFSSTAFYWLELSVWHQISASNQLVSFWSCTSASRTLSTYTMQNASIRCQPRREKKNL